MSLRAMHSTANLPLTLTVTKDGIGGVTGLDCVVSIREAATLDVFLDFADMRFKASGWTTKAQPLAEVGGGTYALVTFDVSAIDNLPPAPCDLVAAYEVLTPGFEAAVAESIQIDEEPRIIEEVVDAAQPIAEPAQPQPIEPVVPAARARRSGKFYRLI